LAISPRPLWPEWERFTGFSSAQGHGKTVLAVRAGHRARHSQPPTLFSDATNSSDFTVSGRCGWKPSRVQAQIATPPGCVHMTLCPSGPAARGKPHAPSPASLPAVPTEYDVRILRTSSPSLFWGGTRRQWECPGLFDLVQVEAAPAPATFTSPVSSRG
jgi:hypothetical protein